jgi:hypothetical protein
VSVLILNGVDDVGKNDLSQHVMGFREYGNELSGSGKVRNISTLSEPLLPFRDVNPCLLESIS